MNRYPIWRYALILIAVVFGLIYTAPNFYGESPAVQISSAKSTLKVQSTLMSRIERILENENIPSTGMYFDAKNSSASVRVRFSDPDTQFKAKALLERELNWDATDPSYIVAFNLLPNTPKWLQSLNALPMYLGLDLRGGVHFLMQVDIEAVMNQRLQGMVGSARTLLRDEKIRHSGIRLNGTTIEARFNSEDKLAKAKTLLTDSLTDLAFEEAPDGENFKLIMTMTDAALKQARDDGIKQNISTLSKRVNELGVAEPVIQRQGADRIVVQLPGVQDVSRAKDIIGRTATLEVRMVDESVTRGMETTSMVPFGSELFTVGKGAPVVLHKEPIITGEYISNAGASFDQNQRASVSVDLNNEGGRKMRNGTRDNIGKLMAIVLFEKGRGEVLTVATIQDELGKRFQITGMGNSDSANDLALLLRAGSLAAPMEIVEERTIGPQLGADNVEKGLNSTLYGFLFVAAFMIIYYRMFGIFSVMALSLNLLLLVGVLSLLQATLTLPGMAAVALTLGMAIDSNVLINERVREELRAGSSPQMAISNGFSHAWATIFDSNITTLIVGLALLAFGSGPVRGFAVVHVLGILTSMFSAVFASRGIVNFWYGRKKKLESISIGQVWKPN